MTFRVGLVYPSSATNCFSLMVGLAIIHGDSAEFMVGFCESIFRVPRGATLAFEPLSDVNGVESPEFMPYPVASEYLGDILPGDAIRLYQARSLDHLAAWSLINHLKGL